MKVLIDTGAMGEFINIKFIRSHELWTYHRPHSIAVYNVDGTLNEMGQTTKAIDLVICYT